MSEPTPNYLQKIVEIGSRLERGLVYSAIVLHDDWCASNFTAIPQDCNCEPIVRVNPGPVKRQ